METTPAQNSNLITQAGVSPRPTPGYTTTEFWLLGGLVVLLILSALLGKMNPEFSGVASTIIALGYAVVRSQVKQDHNESFNDLVDTLLTAQQSLPAPAHNSMGAIVPQTTRESAPGAAAGAAPGSQAGGFADLRALACMCLALVLMAACATLAGLQNNPGIQAAETAGISIGGTLATGSPAFAYVAPIAVNGLTAMANGKNPIAVTGTNLDADVQTITTAVFDAIPNSAGGKAAADIATAYSTAMTSPGIPKTPSGANSVIAAIASGLTTGAASK